MSSAGASCKKNDFSPNDRFNPIGHLKVALLPNVEPNLDKIERGF
jgi:hypothetical protein